MQQFWIFGYGSLMWRPDFEFVRSLPASICGYHRSLCVYSHVHRGTPERPGLVLGLDRGGSCHGIAFEIAAQNWDKTVSYLRGREQVTGVYVEKRMKARILGSRQQVSALTYVADRNHLQYAGVLPQQALVTHVLQGTGESGRCIDYVFNTVAHLRDMKIHDATLEGLADRLRDQTAMSSS
jgi:cation transport protein ChaC